MFSIRLAPVVILLLMWDPMCLGDDNAKQPTSSAPARSQLKPYVDWLPSESETLVVVQGPYDIPAEPPNGDSGPLAMTVREMHLVNMFEGHAREVLAGKRITLWIEASSRFHVPDFPDDIEDVQLTGVPLHYDGCHILVFDEAAPPESQELFERLLQQHPEPTAYIPAARRHRVEGHDAIAYSATPKYRSPGAKETPEETKRIDAAISVRYWIASPKENVLIVATSRDVLAETLRKVENPDQTAFPPSLEEWGYINREMPTWGMRHFRGDPDPTDINQMRRKDGGEMLGMTFEIDSQSAKARLTFLDYDPKSIRWVRASMLRRSSDAQFEIEPDGTVVAEINWSDKAPEGAREVMSGLALWLIFNLGHAVFI